MPTVTIENVGTIEVDKGRRLVLGVEEAGIDILHRCGGNARCATCRVEVVAGEPTPVTPWEEERLSAIKTRESSTRLACQIMVNDALTVQIGHRLSDNPEMGDAGPRPIEWPDGVALEPDSDGS